MREREEVILHTQFSRSVLPRIKEAQLLYMLLDIQCTTEQDLAKFSPVHLCLVLDRSNSMQGERIEMVKTQANLLVKQLKPQDILSVVTFNDRAEVLIPPTRVENLGNLEHRINRIVPGGGTEIFQGLNIGLTQLNGTHNNHHLIQCLILLTDGHTYGDEQNCIEIMKQISNQGITFSALGIGHEWNDIFLDELSSIAGGNTLLVSSEKDLKDFLNQKINSISTAYAKKVLIEFTPIDRVSVNNVFRLYPETGPLSNTSPIHLGNINFGKRASLIIEFFVDPLTPETEQIDLFKGQILMDIASSQNERRMIPISVDLTVSTSPPPEKIQPAVVEAMSRFSLYRLQERARYEVANGKYPQATKTLQYLATHLFSQGDHKLAQAVLTEVDHIQTTHNFTEEGEKRIKYGTKSLFMPPTRE